MLLSFVQVDLNSDYNAPTPAFIYLTALCKCLALIFEDSHQQFSEGNVWFKASILASQAPKRQFLKNGSAVSDLQSSFASLSLSVFIVACSSPWLWVGRRLLVKVHVLSWLKCADWEERRVKERKTSCCLINWRLCQMPTGYRCCFLHSWEMRRQAKEETVTTEMKEGGKWRRSSKRQGSWG